MHAIVIDPMESARDLAGAMPEALSRNGLEKSALNHEESE